MATQYSERSQLADEDDDGLLEVLSKNGIDIQGDELAQNPVQLGENATAVTGATSLGVDTIADSNSSVSVGRDAQATGTDTSAVGAETRAPANWNTVFGYQAGSNKNGENVVIAGRKAEAEGNDTVSIGENARANGNRSAALGKAAAALAQNASVFGQGSTVTGANTTLIGQGVTIDAANATGVGTGITVDADGATAVGSGATASGVDSLALGIDTTVTRDEAVGFGDRDIDLQPGRSIIYDDFSQLFDPSDDELIIRDKTNDVDLIRQPKAGPTNFLQGVDAGPITAPEDSFSQIINEPITSALASGSQVGYSFSLDNQNIIEIKGEANGNGDIQNTSINLNKNVDIIGDVSISGELTEGAAL